MLINLSDDDIEIVGNNTDDNGLIQEMSKKDSMKYRTKVYYNRGISERSDNSSSEEERKRRSRRRDEIYKPACGNLVKYVNNDLLDLSQEERILCDNTLPEPLLKTPVVPRNLPLTSTCRKEKIGRNERERYEGSRTIHADKKRDEVISDERKRDRRRTSGYVSFNTEKDKKRNRNILSSDDENSLLELPNNYSKAELKHSRTKDDKTRRSVSRSDVNNENSESDFSESEREHYSTRTRSNPKNSRKFQPLKPRRGRDAIKSSHFGGTTNESLEAFLIQFHNCVIYNRWSTDDALAHLKSSLTGNALQLLWESPFHDFTFEELVDKLKQRFGSIGQSQKFRAELKSRRRQKGETIQSVYADVCRLLSLAYPNQFELPTTQEVGIDLFLEALEDPALERRVRERELSTLDETFRYCLKLEAYDKAITMRSDSRRQPMH